MKNFVLFFEEKEGSTAVVQALDALDSVSIIRRETESGLGGWEPFEWFNCGSLGPERFRRCLQSIFGTRPVDMERLNATYTSTARAPLRPFSTTGSVGFKMRIVPPWDLPGLAAHSPYRRNSAVDLLCRAIRRCNRERFKDLMRDSLSALDVVVFVMVRQDIFRWAISKYHGDGTGRPGHLQFRMASGDVSAEKLPRIMVDRGRFGRIIDKCAELHRTKRWWFESMSDAGISTHALRYEDFAENRTRFFAQLLAALDIQVADEGALGQATQGTRLRRVHGDDISEYFVNHQEIVDSYGDRFIRW